MKKYDEGYVLAYVTVVLLIFCLVATVILTGALRNLQNQQNTIAQMKDEYFAEGMIEKALTLLDKGGDVAIEEYAKVEAQLPEQLLVSIEDIDDARNSEDNGIYLTMTAKKGSATVTYIIKLQASDVSESAIDGTVTITNLEKYLFVPSLPERKVNEEVLQ